MSPSARKILVGLSTGLLVGLLTACSKQGEGERCDSSKAGDSDCEDGLICTDLNSGTSQALERCCPPSGAPISDDRCNPTRAPSTNGGSTNGGTSGNGPGTGESGADASGGTTAGAGGDEMTGVTSGAGGDADGTTGGSGAMSGAESE